jgi:tetratricopeptide (TPR) repeat protein
MMEGQVWYDTSVFDRAAKCYRDAAAAGRPDGVERELGKTLLSLRENAEAEAQFRAALARDPDDLEAQYFLGAMLVQAGNPAAGQGYLESVARHRPGLWGTYYYLGKARLASGQARAAIPLLQEAARRAPGEVPVQYQLARALQAAGRKAEAARAFKSIGDKQARAADEKIALR